MAELNIVDTGPGGVEGRILTPYLQDLVRGYNFGTGNGYLEFGSGTPGSLPWRVDQSGNETVNNLTVNGSINSPGLQVALPPSGDTTGATDTAAINAALTGFPRKHVTLAPGTFYINAPLTPLNNTWLQGSGNAATIILQTTTFTGNALYQAALSATISDLTLQGATGTTSSNPVADGVYITQNGNYIAGVTVQNVRFANINGWQVHQYDDGTQGAPVGCRFFNNSDGGGNSGGYGFFGDQRTFATLISNCTATANGGTSTTLDGIYFQDVFDIEIVSSFFGSGGTSTGHGWHFLGHNANVRVVLTEIGGGAAATAGTGACGIKIEDGANGHGITFQFIGIVVQQYDFGVSLQGNCADVTFTNAEFNDNQSHGVIVNTAGPYIQFNQCRFAAEGGSNGQGATGTNYDLNWSGSATGNVTNCVFASSIVSTGTIGVQDSINIAAGQQVFFDNVQFAGSGAASTNWSTHTPSSLMVNNNGQHWYAAGFNTPTWQASDSGLVAWNFDPVLMASAVVMATAGTMYVCALKLQAAATVTNILLDFTTAGGTLTSGECFAALYQGRAGTLVGITADQSTTWATSGATGLLTLPLAGGPFLVPAGTLYVGLWFNGTTSPQFRRGNSTPSNNAGLGGGFSRFGIANTGLTNAASAPGTLGAISPNNSTSYWVGLS